MKIISFNRCASTFSKDTVAPVHIIKAHEGVAAELHSFLTSALDVDEHSALHISYFTGKEKNPPEPIEQEGGGGGGTLPIWTLWSKKYL
jgi:hypothetical protein